MDLKSLTSERRLGVIIGIFGRLGSPRVAIWQGLGIDQSMYWSELLIDVRYW